jgi:hypothetical protein
MKYNKYYAYHYLDEDNKDIQVIQSLKEIVKERVTFAEANFSGYPSAQLAINEYIIINWAYPCTKTGEIL